MKSIFSFKGSTADLSGSEMRFGKHPQKMFWGRFSFSGTGSLKPIEVMTLSDKCIGVIERKVITDMRRAFPESEGDVQETQIAVYVLD